MNFKPTPEQERIFHFVKTRPENLLIEAYAGAGKTTVLVEIAKMLPKDKDITFLAFNKHIQLELKDRLPENVRCYTTYGLGMGAIKRKYGDKIVFDEFKVDKIITKKSKSWGLENEFSNHEDIFTYLYDLKKLVNYCRASLSLTLDSIPYLIEKYDVNLNKTEDIKRTLKILDVMVNDRTTYDFTDMIFLPAIDNSIWMFPQDYVAVDEYQDLNRCQIKLIEKIIRKDKITGSPTGRLFAVGDKHQCQPANTKILMSSGEEKNIEDIIIGDKVASYNGHQKGYYVGCNPNHNWSDKKITQFGVNIDNTSKRFYKGDLISIKSNNKTSKYTPNHKCMVRIEKSSKYKHMLYVMEKNGLFRIGIVSIWGVNNSFASNRSKQEDANKMWILKVYDNKSEAYYNEQYYSIMYSIPQLIFNYRDQVGIVNQEIIDKFYNRFDKLEFKNRAESLLKFFKKDYLYPFWEKHTGCYFSKEHMFELHACNILPELMEMILYDDNNFRILNDKKHNMKAILPTYSKIEELKYEHYEGYVYSLEVKKHEVYVADGILTHNSIYSFNCSDSQSFTNFEKYPNTKVLPLSYSFRCAKNIIANANSLVKEIKALDTAPDGIVRHNGNVLKEAETGDFVLCRTTMPLVKLFFSFLVDHKKAVIKGSDIGINLIEMIGKTTDIQALKTHWTNEVIKFKQALYGKGILNPSEHSGYVSLEDKVTVLLFLAQITNTINELKQKITFIFSDDVNGRGIILSTVHKAKGLEADKVFIIRPDLLPMKTVRKPWQVIEERNISYVALTRAKLELAYDYEYDKPEEK